MPNASAISKYISSSAKWGKGNTDFDGLLSIAIFGASGNLAMNKVLR